MTICMHEIKRGRISFLIWTGVIAGMIVICMALYPEMKTQMAGVSALFANMGSFTAAFGMDMVNFGEVMGFYAIECGNVLGLGGAFYAALLGSSALAKEEKEHTAEFLLTHPVSRRAAVLQKGLAVFLQILAMNVVIAVLAALSFQMIGEEIQADKFLLVHVAFFVMQIEIAGICLGISAFLRGNGWGAGIGIAVVLYFMNLLINLSDQAGALQYVTPFAYAEATDIVASGRIDGGLLGLGLAYMILGLCIGGWYYSKKDITG